MKTEAMKKMLEDQILVQLENGNVPWKKNWEGILDAPKSLSTGNEYGGFNYFMLAMQNYESPFWGTYKQIKNLKGNVKEGEKGTKITFYKTVVKNKDTDDEERFGLLRYFNVFNVDQCENVKIPKRFEPEVNETENDYIENCESVISGYKDCPEIKFGMNPCYIPSKDIVGMPKINQFQTASDYYDAMFHEFGHSTKSNFRLTRNVSKDREEMVAEFCSFYLCAMTGIESAVIENQAAYIKGWSKKIKEDTGMILQCSSMGWKASQYILGKHL